MRHFLPAPPPPSAAGDATKLLTRHQWREGDVVLLEANASRIQPAANLANGLPPSQRTSPAPAWSVLLRRMKGTDLSFHGTDDLAAVPAALNARPRKTLGWRTPAEALGAALQSAKQYVSIQYTERLFEAGLAPAAAFLLRVRD
jgi:hypothetical protein